MVKATDLVGLSYALAGALGIRIEGGSGADEQGGERTPLGRRRSRSGRLDLWQVAPSDGVRGHNLPHVVRIVGQPEMPGSLIASRPCGDGWP